MFAAAKSKMGGAGGAASVAGVDGVGTTAAAPPSGRTSETLISSTSTLSWEGEDNLKPASVSIIAFTTADAPENEFIIRTGTIGLITLSSALTTHFAVVAASQRTVFCWTSTVLDGFVASAGAASLFAEKGRKSMASGDKDDF